MHNDLYEAFGGFAYDTVSAAQPDDDEETTKRVNSYRTLMDTFLATTTIREKCCIVAAMDPMEIDRLNSPMLDAVALIIQIFPEWQDGQKIKLSTAMAYAAKFDRLFPVLRVLDSWRTRETPSQRVLFQAVVQQRDPVLKRDQSMPRSIRSAEFLLSKGEKFKAGTYSRMTKSAVQHKNLPMIELLISHGVEFGEGTFWSFFQSPKYRDVLEFCYGEKVVRELIHKHMPAQQAFSVAIAGDDVGLLSLLLDFGGYGMEPTDLSDARYFRFLAMAPKKCFQYLLDRGGNILGPANNMLEMAIKAKWPVDDIQILLQAGADPTFSIGVALGCQYPTSTALLECLKSFGAQAPPNMIESAHTIPLATVKWLIGGATFTSSSVQLGISQCIRKGYPDCALELFSIYQGTILREWIDTAVASGYWAIVKELGKRGSEIFPSIHRYHLTHVFKDYRLMHYADFGIDLLRLFEWCGVDITCQRDLPRTFQYIWESCLLPLPTMMKWAIVMDRLDVVKSLLERNVVVVPEMIAASVGLWVRQALLAAGGLHLLRHPDVVKAVADHAHTPIELQSWIDDGFDVYEFSPFQISLILQYTQVSLDKDRALIVLCRQPSCAPAAERLLLDDAKASDEALKEAAKYGNFAMVDLLIRHGADPAAIPEFMSTPCMKAYARLKNPPKLKPIERAYDDDVETVMQNARVSLIHAVALSILYQEP